MKYPKIKNHLSNPPVIHGDCKSVAKAERHITYLRSIIRSKHRNIATLNSIIDRLKQGKL